MELHWLKRKNEAGEDIKFYPITHKDAIMGFDETEYAKQADFLAYKDNVSENFDDINEALQNVSTVKDWNQNDPSHPDYIENRPFYTIKDGYTTESRETVVEETIIPIERVGSLPEECYIELDIEEGKTYIVTWDGIEYSCVGKSHEGIGINYLGNTKVVLIDDNDTGEPFGIVNLEGDTLTFGDTEGDHSIKIEKSTTVVVPDEVVKLDQKYVYNADWNQNDPNGDGYIANRTHWGETKFVELFRIENPRFSYNYCIVPCKLNVGQTYYVKWGSEDVYELVALADSNDPNEIVMGNVSNEADGVPFFFSCQIDQGVSAIYRAYDSNFYTGDPEYIAASTYKEIIGHLDEKYIPDDLKAGRSVYGKTFEYNFNGSDETHIAQIYAETFNGDNNIAIGAYSHAEGFHTIAASELQHVQGKYNIPLRDNLYAHIVGNGDSNTNRSNAHTLDWNGVAWYAGDVYTGGDSQTDTDAKKLATEEFVATQLAASSGSVEYGETQDLTDTEKETARTNIGLGESSDVKHNSVQINYLTMKDKITGIEYFITIENGVIIYSSKLTSIEITNTPNKMTFFDDEVLGDTDIEITAYYEDGTSRIITDYTYEMVVGSETINIYYTVNGVTCSTVLDGVTIISASERPDLIDFEYTFNEGGTFTLTDWKGTYNGIESNKIIIPNNERIIL